MQRQSGPFLPVRSVSQDGPARAEPVDYSAYGNAGNSFTAGNIKFGSGSGGRNRSFSQDSAPCRTNVKGAHSSSPVDYSFKHSAAARQTMTVKPLVSHGTGTGNKAATAASLEKTGEVSQNSSSSTTTVEASVASDPPNSSVTGSSDLIEAEIIDGNTGKKVVMMLSPGQVEQLREGTTEVTSPSVVSPPSVEQKQFVETAVPRVLEFTTDTPERSAEQKETPLSECHGSRTTESVVKTDRVVMPLSTNSEACQSSQSHSQVAGKERSWTSPEQSRSVPASNSSEKVTQTIRDKLGNVIGMQLVSKNAKSTTRKQLVSPSYAASKLETSVMSREADETGTSAEKPASSQQSGTNFPVFSM